MPKKDERCVVGAAVISLAKHVLNNAECSRRFGALKDKKWLNGIVRGIFSQKSRKNVTQRFLEVDFELGSDTIKSHRMSLRSVRMRSEYLDIFYGILMLRDELTLLSRIEFAAAACGGCD